MQIAYRVYTVRTMHWRVRANVLGADARQCVPENR